MTNLGGEIFADFFFAIQDPNFAQFYFYDSIISEKTSENICVMRKFQKHFAEFNFVINYH